MERLCGRMSGSNSSEGSRQITAGNQLPMKPKPCKRKIWNDGKGMSGVTQS
jgi:hypothetical protein